jgi:hypothetical protein
LGDLDVSLITPCGCPRVLYDPGVGVITYEKNGMVDKAFSEAASIIKNTTAVELEGHLVSFEVDSDGTILDGILKGINIVDSNVGTATNLERVGNLAILASLINTFVRVVGLKADTFFEDVGVRVLDPATTATEVTIACSAVNKLLFREAWDLTTLGGKTFKGSGCGESPARSALCLVLNCSDSALSSPIKSVRALEAFIQAWSRAVVGLLSESGAGASVEGSEFLAAEVSELVQGQGVVLIFGVVGLDELVVALEDVESGFFFRTSVSLVVLSFPGFPGSLDGSFESEDSKLAGVSVEDAEGSYESDESKSSDDDSLLGEHL